MIRKSSGLPRAGPERESLRQKGQFWTPPWIAEAMVSYALAGGADRIFDPAVGAGAFFLAAKKIANERHQTIGLSGTEVDSQALDQGTKSGLSKGDIDCVSVGDFVLNPSVELHPAIVANPPYIRHHRLSGQTKAALRRFGAKMLGAPLDGRTGYHVYFLVRALSRLQEGGRLSFIVPADTCEGIFAPQLWAWISAHYRIDGVVTFAPKATPFPGVDINPVILCISSQSKTQKIYWALCREPETPELRRWMESDFTTKVRDLDTYVRPVSEALATGLSRAPAEPVSGPTLGDFAFAMRGIATGANEYYLFTRERARAAGIPMTFFRRVIGRTRDVEGDRITIENLDNLDKQGRPTFLLYLDGRPVEELPPEARAYIAEGERLGHPDRPLITTRSPWYKMEQREPPPFLFAYLGRRNCRFIRNTARALPLTGFLCLYSKQSENVEKLWNILNHPSTLANLSRVGKTYGSGAVKVEPRALERLPLSPSVVVAAGLDTPIAHMQAALTSFV